MIKNKKENDFKFFGKIILFFVISILIISNIYFLKVGGLKVFWDITKEGFLIFLIMAIIIFKLIKTKKKNKEYESFSEIDQKTKEELFVHADRIKILGILIIVSSLILLILAIASFLNIILIQNASLIFLAIIGIFIFYLRWKGLFFVHKHENSNLMEILPRSYSIKKTIKPLSIFAIIFFLSPTLFIILPFFFPNAQEDLITSVSVIIITILTIIFFITFGILLLIASNDIKKLKK